MPSSGMEDLERGVGGNSAWQDKRYHGGKDRGVQRQRCTITKRSVYREVRGPSGENKEQNGAGPVTQRRAGYSQPTGVRDSAHP